MTTPVARLENMRFAWPGGDGERLAIDQFDVAPGARIALIGPSGAGKSTLLNLLAGVVAPDAGVLEVLGADFTRLSAAKRDRVRADGIGVIFQQFNLLPYGTVRDNVSLPLAFSRRRRARVEASGGARKEVDRLLSALGLAVDRLGDRAAADLSVGQQQRVAAARALIGGPALILADEPTAALDRANADAFLDLLFAEADAARAAIVAVTHDPAVAARFQRTVPLEELARPREAAA